MARLDELAYMVWSEYYDRMAQAYKYVSKRGYGPADHKYAKAFYTIARACLDNGFDPRHYVAKTMELFTQPLPGEERPRRVVTPSDLTTDKILKRYKISLAEERGTSDELWDGQIIQLLRVKLMSEQPLTDEDALYPLYTPFDNWFRVLYITPMNEKLFEQYGKAAWADLSKDRLLREFLRTKTPKNMAELERRIGQFGDV